MKRTALRGSLCLALAIPATALAQTPHAISGSLSGTITFVLLPTVPGPNGEVVDSLGDASGIVRGLGQTHLFTFHRPWGPNLEYVEDGLFRIVAANGDELKGHYEGSTGPGTEPNQQIGTADWIITGGTGRFANASGIIQITAYVTVLGIGVPEWPCTWVLKGTISY
jgi:hypothetical protein